MDKRKLSIILVVCFGLVATILYMEHVGREGDLVSFDEGDVPLGTALRLDVSSQGVVDDLKEIETLLQKTMNTSDTDKINHAVLAIIRKDRYGYESSSVNRFLWGRFAGTLEAECGISSSDLTDNGEYEQIVRTAESLGRFNDPVSGDEIDLVHMLAVVDIGITDVLAVEYQERYYDAIFTWAGDLETFIIEMDAFSKSGGGSGYAANFDYARSRIGSKNSKYFSTEDLLADMDGLNISAILNAESVLLSDAMESYYTRGGVGSRSATFIKNHGGKETFNETVNGVVNYKVEKKYSDDEAYHDFLSGFNGFKSLMLRSVNSAEISLNRDMRNALTDAFIEVVVEF